MKLNWQRLFGPARILLTTTKGRMMLLFAVEGIFIQFAMSVNGFGNNLYATNMGATDAQIGLIQTVPNLVAVLLLLPSGILGDRCKSSKTMPIVILCFMAIMYFFFGTVPAMGANRMSFFFVFLGLTAGVVATYNAQWQTFFGDVTDERERNGVFTFRNRFMLLVGVLTPLACGAAMAAVTGSEAKLNVLRVFYYICGVFLLLQAVTISRIPGGRHKADPQAAAQKFSLRDLGAAFVEIKNNKPFLSYFFCILFFYLGWHSDFSMWYLGQVQYVHMTEAQLSYFSALACVVQLLSIGLWAKLNMSKSVHFSIIFGMLGLWFCPITMLISTAMPDALRPITFIVFGTIANFPQSCIGLCTVQMLLGVVPEKNRSLIISLYTIVITLSNSLMPLLGVQLYTALGANLNAMRTFNTIVAVWRGLAVCLFVFRYLRMKKNHTLSLPDGSLSA